MATDLRSISTDLALLNEQTWLHLGQLSETMKDPERAVLAYESALRHNPYSEQSLKLVATLCRSLEQHSKAADYYQRIVKMNETNGEAWSALGYCYLMLDDLHKSYSAYQSALTYLPDPKEPNLWYHIGILYDRFGSRELAEEAFLSVLRMDPAYEKANEIHFRLAVIYKQDRKFDQSLEASRCLISAAIIYRFRHILKSPPPPLLETDIWFQIGHVHEQQKEYQYAREAYEKAMSDTHKQAKVMQQLGWLYHQTSAPFCSQDRAIALLRQSIDLDSSDAQTWYLMGRCYMAQQKYNDAYEAYQQAVYRDGRNAAFWCSIGVLYYQISQYPDALDAYTRAIRLNPLISEVWYDLGTLYEACNNQVADALDAYGRALELDPNNTQIKQRLSILRNSQPGAAPPPALPPQQPAFQDRNTIVAGIQTGPSPQYQNNSNLSPLSREPDNVGYAQGQSQSQGQNLGQGQWQHHQPHHHQPHQPQPQQHQHQQHQQQQPYHPQHPMHPQYAQHQQQPHMRSSQQSMHHGGPSSRRPGEGHWQSGSIGSTGEFHHGVRKEEHDPTQPPHVRMPPRYQ